MQPSPIPQWVRVRLTDFLDGYRKAAGLCEDRCTDLAVVGIRNEDGDLYDEVGTIDEYRLDAKYCAGQASRLKLTMEGRATPEEHETESWREVPYDPRRIARWAWQNPWKRVAPLPRPKDAMRTLRLHEMLQEFTQREAEALILVEGLRLPYRKAAKIMGCSEKTLDALLCTARHRFGSNDNIG